MYKMIQVRNVPEGLHRRLKYRAALEGCSLSEYLVKVLEQVVSRPTLREMADRLATRTAVKFKISPTEILRKERSRR
jgi:plasmid stability protein